MRQGYMKYDAVVDAYAWIEYFRGSQKGETARSYIEGGKTATPIIVIAELSDKYEREDWKTWETDLDFVLSNSAVAELSVEIASKAGRTKNTMRKQQPDFGIADAIILETAHALNTQVLTGDKHFAGLKEAIFLD